MAESRFDIQFQGKLVAGADPESVKANLMRLFKIDEARAAGMLSGKTVTLKRNADQATAMKFRAALKQAGAVCQLVDLTAAAEQQPEAPSSKPAVAAPESAAPASEASAAAASGDFATVGTIRTSGEGFSGDFQVEPPGALMDQAHHDTPPAAPDVSAISMAPVGSDMGQKPKDAPPPPPDTSGLSLESED